MPVPEPVTHWTEYPPCGKRNSARWYSDEPQEVTCLLCRGTVRFRMHTEGIDYRTATRRRGTTR